METLKIMDSLVPGARPKANRGAVGQLDGDASAQLERSGLCLGAARRLAMSGLVLLLLPACSVVKVYDQKGESLKGIPFVTKKVVRKQETVWQQSGSLVSMKATSTTGKESVDLGSVVVAPGDFEQFKALFDGDLRLGEIYKRLTDFFDKPATKGRELRLVSNKEIVVTVLDEERYFISARRPLVGSASFAPEFNTDAMLTKLNASAEDKTIPTLLDPFKDALGAAAKAALTVKSMTQYKVEISKSEQRIIALITVTKKLNGKDEIGGPIEPPSVNTEQNRKSYPAGVEVVVSKPDEKKSEEDKAAFKFSGSVSPPKSSP